MAADGGIGRIGGDLAPGGLVLSWIVPLDASGAPTAAASWPAVAAHLATIDLPHRTAEGAACLRDLAFLHAGSAGGGHGNDNFAPFAVSAALSITSPPDHAAGTDLDGARLDVAWTSGREAGADAGATGSDHASDDPPAAPSWHAAHPIPTLSVVIERDGAPIGLALPGSNVVRLTGAAGGDAHAGGAGVANDNAGDAAGIGPLARDVQVSGLVSGDTIVTWVRPDGTLDGIAIEARHGGEHDLDASGPAAALATSLSEILQAAGPVPVEQRPRIVDWGRDGFAVLWAVTIAGVIVLKGHLIAPSDDGEGWAGRPAGEIVLPERASATLGTETRVLGWSEETGATEILVEIDGEPVPVTLRLVDTRDSGPVLEATGFAAVETVATRAAGSASPFAPTPLPEPAPIGDAPAGPGPADAPAASAPASFDAPAFLHAGVVDVEGTGGRVVVTGTFTEQDGVAGLSSGDAVSNTDDEIEGTGGDDVIIADLPDPTRPAGKGPIEGGDDEIRAGAGDDVIYGGGGDDLIDGGSSAPDGSADDTSTDTAIFTGSAHDYSITANGDGTYTVVIAKSDTGTGVDRSTDGFEGIDTAQGIEQYQFLDGDTDYIVRIVNGEDIASLGTSGHQVVLASDLYQLPEERNAGAAPFDGTPTAWGLTRDEDGDVDNSIVVASVAGGDDAGEIATPIAAATAHGGFAVGWVADGALHVTLHDALGAPRALGADGATTVAIADDVDTSVAPVITGAGDGAAVAWVAAGPAAKDDAAPASGGGINVLLVSGHEAPSSVSIALVAGGTVTDLQIAGSTGSGGAPGQVVVAWVEAPADAAPGEGSGLVVVATHAVDGDGALDDAGQGPVVVGEGRAPDVTVTSEGSVAAVWVAPSIGAVEGDAAEELEGRVIDALGITVESFSIPLTDGRQLRDGTRPTIDTAGNGDLVVTWQELHAGESGLDVMSALLRQLGPNSWAQPIIRELRHFDDEPGEVTIAVAGENGDALILTWQSDGEGGGEIVGQTISIAALATPDVPANVGVTFDVAGGAGAGPSYDGASVVGLDDGRVVVVMRETAGAGGEDCDGASEAVASPQINVVVEMFDTRDPADILIADAAGAGDNQHVGTTGDDIIDGRIGTDALYGGLGGDVLTGGMNDDVLDGGEGDDTLLGGSGSDQLAGGKGDDLLMGGFGRDYVSGGDGDDTVSYRGETRAVTVDLAAGIVRSDAGHNAVGVDIGDREVRGIDRATLLDASVEDILGTMRLTNAGSQGAIEIDTRHGIENAEGGLGDDILRGDSGANVLTGGKGDDLLDGRGGTDTACFSGASTDYDLRREGDGSFSIKHARNTSASTNDGTDRLVSIEELAFSDGRFVLGADGQLSAQAVAAALGITSEIVLPPLDQFQFCDLDDLDSGNGSGKSGSSSSGGGGSTVVPAALWQPEAVDPALCGLASDTLYFGDLDALDAEVAGRTASQAADELWNCTVFASEIQIDIEAALMLGEADAADALMAIDSMAIDIGDPHLCHTEFRLG